jgi:hypothetical protein
MNQSLGRRANLSEQLAADNRQGPRVASSNELAVRRMTADDKYRSDRDGQRSHQDNDCNDPPHDVAVTRCASQRNDKTSCGLLLKKYTIIN